MLVDADRSRLARFITRYTLQSADMILVDSNAVRAKIRALVDYPEDRFVSFPWGIDLDTFRRQPSASPLRRQLGWHDNPVVLSTRSWEPIYDVTTLVEAFAQALRIRPDLRLVLAADGSLRSEVHRLLRERGLSEVVHLPGRVPNDLLVQYYSLADVYVSTSRSDGASISLLEAMACGLAIVVADIPSNREWITPGVNGWLFEPADSAGLAATLLRALGAWSRRDELAAKNRELVERRANWDRNFPLLLGAYGRMAAPRR